MVADLIGPEFDIEAKQIERMQPIERNGKTEWEWEIVASNEGLHNLNLDLGRYLSSPQGETPHWIVPAPINDYINVEATSQERVTDFFGRKWQWLLAAILVPVVLQMISLWRGDNSSSANTGKDSE